MTVQEIQEIGFEKAVFGGYDMKSVDTFLERVAEEFAAMQKENAALKAKMKVLVDKIEEYRGVEDGMRRALMSAQTIAQDTIDKAKQEAQDIVTAAKDETENKVKNTRDEITLEEQKLEAAKKSTLEFVARISAAYQAQAKALVELAKSEKLVGQQQSLPYSLHRRNLPCSSKFLPSLNRRKSRQMHPLKMLHANLTLVN